MKITDIKIFKTKKSEPVLAYANIILDNYFIIRGITLLETEKGRFISMPSRKVYNGKKQYRDMCHPLDNKIREEITENIFEVYDEFMASEK